MRREKENKLASGSWLADAGNFILNFILAAVWLLKSILRFVMRPLTKNKSRR